MTAPKLAITRPAALTGRVGQGGDNRVHDVALVQALLGLKRAKGGRFYMSGNVTGKYDKETAVALLRFRMDQRDANIKQPLARSGPMLNKLALGQSLAVLEGTAIPYSYKTMAEAGPIRGLKAKELSAERTTELMQVMKAFTRDWGIAFDVEVEVAAFDPSARSTASARAESRPLVARFTPRNFFVHNGRRLSSIMTNPLFLAIAKPLYQAVAADLKARCAEAFAIKDPVDVKIQQGLKDDLACVVRTDLEGVEALAQVILAGFRKTGLKLAARFFEHYLGASGSSIEVRRDEALEFDLIKNAAQENAERFKQRNFIAPEQSTPGFLAVEEITKNPKARFTQFEDHWKVDLNFTVAGIERFDKARKTDETDTASAFLATGASSVTSTGDFLLRRQGAALPMASRMARCGRRLPANRERFPARCDSPLDQLRDAPKSVIDCGLQPAIKEGQRKAKERIVEGTDRPKGANEQQPMKPRLLPWLCLGASKGRPNDERQEQNRV